MEVIICDDSAQVAETAADFVAETLGGRPHPVIGLATGSSPLALYQALAERQRHGAFAVEGLSAFALDEYVGLTPEHEQSYAQTIRTVFTEPLGVDPARVHVPDGMAADLAAGCQAYEDAIAAAGGIDVQILGIGSNGHLGFNEPTSSFASRTRLKTLTRRTRDDNARFFAADETVPSHCVTQGLGTIMDARRLVLVAQGASKAAAIAAAVEGPVTAMCPASVMQFHRDASVIVDEAAASQLALADYYRDVWQSKLEYLRSLTLPGR